MTHTGQTNSTDSQHVHAQPQAHNSSSHRHPSGSTHVNAVGAAPCPQATQSSSHHHQRPGNAANGQTGATLDPTQSTFKAVELMNSLEDHLKKVRGDSNRADIDAMVNQLRETSHHLAKDELARLQDLVAKSAETSTK